MRAFIPAKPPTPTRGFDAYWQFAAERQKLYHGRLAGIPSNVLTQDPVIAAHRFTNPYRAADRVSQYLIGSVQYNQQWSWIDTFVRTLVFKIFNRIETWNHLLSEIGEPDCSTLFDRAIDRSLGRVADRHPIYSAAYIMPPPRSVSGPKYVRHLTLVRNMVSDGAHLEILEAPSMSYAYSVLRRYESIGDFLAYQFITDLNYSRHLSFSEQEFVIPGPGALRGLRKCFTDAGDLSDDFLLQWTLEQQYTAFDRRELSWQGLWGRALQLIDIQNLFCEVDKYTRVAMPELSEFASGKRIKQRYRPNPARLTAWFPPKWEINDRITPSIGLNSLVIQLHLFTSNGSTDDGQFAVV